MEPETFTTAEEFEEWYAKNSGVTVQWLRENGRFGAPCDCGDEICKGWQMARLGDADQIYPSAR